MVFLTCNKNVYNVKTAYSYHSDIHCLVNMYSMKAHTQPGVYAADDVSSG